MEAYRITAEEAKKRLLDGNRKYTGAQTLTADVSPAALLRASRHGQQPYAVIVTCSDSRVIPELIFSAGIGDLFVIRVAGNVIDPHQLGSIEYSAEHLGTGLIVVLGHTHCGAVEAAMHHEPDGYIRDITDEILEAIGDEKDPVRAACLNVQGSCKAIEDSLQIRKDEAEYGLVVCGALYRLEDGKAEALEFLIKEKSEITDTPLQDLDIRSNTLICSIARNGEIIIPSGRSEIRVGDSVVVVLAGYKVSDIREILK